jgi:uncharacterized membrane protein
VPLILLFVLLSILLIAGVITASSAFLAERDLQADCDGAAVAAASALDAAGFYSTSAGNSAPAVDSLPLALSSARAAITQYQSITGLGSTSFTVTIVGGTNAQVVCRRSVPVPFQAIFGYTEGVPRTAISDARSPLRGGT